MLLSAETLAELNAKNVMLMTTEQSNTTLREENSKLNQKFENEKMKATLLEETLDRLVRRVCKNYYFFFNFPKIQFEFK